MSFLSRLFIKQTNEVLHAKHFVNNAKNYIKSSKYELPNKQEIREAIDQPEFDYWAMLVALRAADSGAIIKYGIENPLTIKLLRIMIKEFQKINRYVSQNLQYNQIFIQELDEYGRLSKEIKTIQEANGFWLLYSLKLETLEYTDPNNREAAKIIGNWLFDKYTKYWDSIPNYK
jgi:hypothetical protein